MLHIPLQPIPNQRLSVRLEGVLFSLTLKAARTMLAITIIRNGVTVVQGVRCLPGTALIPRRYQEGEAGNFYFLTDGNSYPDYTRLGSKDRLFYLAKEELEVLRNV